MILLEAGGVKLAIMSTVMLWHLRVTTRHRLAVSAADKQTRPGQ
jgi:hypothetical protein